MDRVMKILVASDGSEAVTRACEILIPTLEADARVRVMTVLSYEMYPFSLIADIHLADESERKVHAEQAADDATRDARLMFEKAGVSVETTYRYGNPVDEILAEVDRWQPTMLVMGRRRVRGLERMLGSVSEHVVRRVGVPVLLVP